VTCTLLFTGRAGASCHRHLAVRASVTRVVLRANSIREPAAQSGGETAACGNDGSPPARVSERGRPERLQPSHNRSTPEASMPRPWLLSRGRGHRVGRVLARTSLCSGSPAGAPAGAAVSCRVLRRRQTGSGSSPPDTGKSRLSPSVGGLDPDVSSGANPVVATPLFGEIAVALLGINIRPRVRSETSFLAAVFELLDVRSSALSREVAGFGPPGTRRGSFHGGDGSVGHDLIRIG
jgi:hypothetical protein